MAGWKNKCVCLHLFYNDDNTVLEVTTVTHSNKTANKTCLKCLKSSSTPVAIAAAAAAVAAMVVLLQHLSLFN